MPVNRIHALRRTGNLAGAMAACRGLMAKEPENAEAVHLLGLLLSQTGKIDESVMWLRKSLALDAHQERYWQNLVAVLMGAGRVAEAHEAAREAVGLFPNSGNAWGQLGGVLEAMGQVQEAAEAFAKAVERLANLLPAQRGLADALLELGQAPNAVEHFQAAIKLSPDDYLLYSALLFAMQAELNVTRAFTSEFRSFIFSFHASRRSKSSRRTGLPRAQSRQWPAAAV